MPGNHDWYDGLKAFRRLFCTGRSIGAWRTRQERSYFACRLTHGWWLLAVTAAMIASFHVLIMAFSPGHEAAKAACPHRLTVGYRSMFL